jgi:hypothetical protein
MRWRCPKARIWYGRWTSWLTDWGTAGHFWLLNVLDDFNREGLDGELREVARFV